MSEQLMKRLEKEVSVLHDMEKALNELHMAKQRVTAQLQENEFVQDEFSRLDDGAVIYKMVGPVMTPVSLTDSKDTVAKRLEYLRGENDRLALNIVNEEKKVDGQRSLVIKMQADLQSGRN